VRAQKTANANRENYPTAEGRSTTSRTDENNCPGGLEVDSPPEKPKGTVSMKSKRQDDPLSWYGILVPPSLRKAQKDFTAAIEGNVPELMDVMIDMRDVESQIYKLRKEVGQREARFPIVTHGVSETY